LGSRAAIGDRSERAADILQIRNALSALRWRGWTRLAGLRLIRQILLSLVGLSADLRPKRRAQANRQARSHTEKNISHD
jgi:hypothetical protein